MFASLQNVLPASILSSISTIPAAKSQPREDADDAAERDSYPSSSPTSKPMAVDEQGAKKKKGRSNEVSFSLSARVVPGSPQISLCLRLPTPPSVQSLDRRIHLTTVLPHPGFHRRSTAALKDEPPSQPSGATRTTQLSRSHQIDLLPTFDRFPGYQPRTRRPASPHPYIFQPFRRLLLLWLCSLLHLCQLHQLHNLYQTDDHSALQPPGSQRHDQRRPRRGHRRTRRKVFEAWSRGHRSRGSRSDGSMEPRKDRWRSFAVY